MSDQYRPHIDGIRALAVAMVVTFHLGYAWIPGGFVGVDVFFVLSGYLITGLLLREAGRTETVRLGRFFARRVRRLLPASLAVLAATLAAGSWLLDAVQRDSLGRDLLWASLYSANWRFVSGGGDYFAPGDVPSPVVHFWTLAVEEQFYLAWPLVFWLVFRLSNPRRRTVPEDGTAGARALQLGPLLAVTAVAAATSLALSIRLVGSPIAYYGTHTRAYQLLAGALMALAVARWPARLDRTAAGPRWALGGTVVAGLSTVALLALATGIPDAAAYPGWPGLAVTMASLGLIAAVDLTPRGRHSMAFGTRPAAAIGRWSYSIYIWHWPVIVFAPLAAERMSWDWLTERPSMLLVIGVAALISYFLVERPIRFGFGQGVSPRRVVAIGLTASVLMAVTTTRVIPPPDELDEIALAAVRDAARPEPCPYFADEWPAPTSSEPCVWRDGDGPTVALVGDSHALQWQPAIDVLAERDDARVVRLTRAGCPANDVTVFITNESGRDETDDDCSAWRRHTYAQLVERYDPDVVLVATRSHVRGITTDDGNLDPGAEGHLEAWAAGWEWTLDTLGAKGGTVVVSRILPTLAERVPACLLDHGFSSMRCNFRVDADRDVVAPNQVIDSLAAPPGVVVVDPTPMVCPGKVCRAVLGDIVVHRDDNHLSATFVASRAQQFHELLDRHGVDI